MTNIFKNRLILGVLCLILAVIVGFVAVPAYTRVASATTTVVVATEEIYAGQKLTEDMVKEVEMGKDNLPDGVLDIKAELIGCYALENIHVGYYLTTKTVAREIVLPEQKISRLKYGEHYTRIPVSGLFGTMRYLPNDIIAFWKTSGENGTTTKIENLSRIKVVAMYTSENTPILTENQINGEGGAAAVPTDISLILTDNQYITLMSEKAKGELSVTLEMRPKLTTQVKTEPASVNVAPTAAANTQKATSSTAARTTQRAVPTTKQ